MRVIDKSTGKRLSNEEILIEVNRDRSEEWANYDLWDIENIPKDVASWIDTEYYDVAWSVK